MALELIALASGLVDGIGPTSLLTSDRRTYRHWGFWVTVPYHRPRWDSDYSPIIGLSNDDF